MFPSLSVLCHRSLLPAIYPFMDVERWCSLHCLYFTTGHFVPFIVCMSVLYPFIDVERWCSLHCLYFTTGLFCLFFTPLWMLRDSVPFIVCTLDVETGLFCLSFTPLWMLRDGVPFIVCTFPPVSSVCPLPLYGC